MAESSGFSLHAGIAAEGSQRDKLEHLARHVSRPHIANARLALTQDGQVCYLLKRPYRDGTTHVIFEPEDFIARFDALVPRTRAAAANQASQRGAPSATGRQRALTWAQRLKRVIASLEAPAVIERILAHLGRDSESLDPAHPSCAPPKPDRPAFPRRTRKS